MYKYILFYFFFLQDENVSFFSSFEQKRERRGEKRNTIPNYFNGCRVCVNILFSPYSLYPVARLSCRRRRRLQMKQVCYFITQVSS